LNGRTGQSSSAGTSHLGLWLAPLVWMALIFAVSGTPADRIPKAGAWDQLVKKGGHMLAYALLTILWLRPLGARLPTRPAAFLACSIALLYAISDEYHQTFVPGRNGNGFDVMVDGVGVLGALLAWGWVGRRRRSGAA
jgi:VanZ family protein